jgi:hypothetical protein
MSAIDTARSPQAIDVAPHASRTSLPRARRSGTLALAAIIVFALVLRLVGIRHLLPHQADPDGNVFVTQLELLQEGVSSREREFLSGFYPTLIARLASAAPHAGPEVLAQSAPRTLEGQLAAASTEYLRLRYVVAILSVLLVPGTWLLARRFAGPGAALCAAALAATSLLDLWFAQQARPHAASAAFALLAVLAATSLRRNGRPIDYVATGLALGLAVGSLQSGIAVMLPIAAAVVLRSENAKRTSSAWIVALLACAAVFVLLFYPSLFAPTRSTSGGVRFDADDQKWNVGGHFIYWRSFKGEGVPRVWRALTGYETWIFALAIVGGVMALLRWPRIANDKERARDLMVVFAYAIPYLVAISLYARTYQRFVIPLIPYLACLAGYAIARIAVLASALRAPRDEPRASLGAIVALVLLAPQFVAAIRLVSARGEPDTAHLAADWIAKNVKPSSEKVLVQYPLELPLPSTPESLEDDDKMMGDTKHPWVLYQRALAPSRRLAPAWNLTEMPMRDDALRAKIQHDPVAYLKQLGGDYAVIDVYEGGRPPLVLNVIRPALREIGERVARFSPDGADDGSNFPIMYQDDEYPTPTCWFARILGARCTGPVIEIYELRR